MTTGHSAETSDFLTERAYALSSYALTYVALKDVFLPSGLTAGPWTKSSGTSCSLLSVFWRGLQASRLPCHEEDVLCHRDVTLMYSKIHRDCYGPHVRPPLIISLNICIWPYVRILLNKVNKDINL